jgi:predicted nucleic acid-binding Zn ribbon protein
MCLHEDEMPENLPDHEHCAQCDDAVPVGQRFCSPECEATFNKKQKKDRQRNIMFMVAAIAIFVALGLFSLLPK